MSWTAIRQKIAALRKSAVAPPAGNGGAEPPVLDPTEKSKAHQLGGDLIRSLFSKQEAPPEASGDDVIFGGGGGAPPAATPWHRDWRYMLPLAAGGGLGAYGLYHLLAGAKKRKKEAALRHDVLTRLAAQSICRARSR